MSDRMKETMAALAEKISKQTAETQDEIRVFLEGYTAALERVLSQQEES